ncbi:protein FAM181B [Tachyglossus aculeatus]|uniref:protein FAM181B n=1 Tax=Tachyglossus aculeatus TaxID=9261 RepID=UPI0018F63E98|nr:protein FAM181B [Tachyglossus aculeatus]
MAVQAALLAPHHFAPFLFPSTPASGEEGRGSGATGVPQAGVGPGDGREATRDLLSFIDSASSNIKMALDKPGKSKRKVNHRKYLQKQIKRCTGLGSSTPCSSTTSSEAPSRRPPASSALQSRSLAALFDSLHPPAPRAPSGSPGPAKKLPLRHRNLPPSFFTEPTRARGLREPEKGGGEPAADFFDLLGPDYAGAQLEPGLFEVHPAAVGGLLYPEAWNPPCPLPKKASSGPGRPLTLEEPLGPAPGLGATGGAGEETPGQPPAFAPFFPDCPLSPHPTPQMPYDFSAGFSRGGFSGL